METLTSKTSNIKTDAERLNDWLTDLSVKEYPDMIESILSGCMINKDKLNNWRYGKTKIEPIYKVTIETIAGKKIFES